MEFYGILSVLTKDIKVQYMITDYYRVEAKIKLKCVFLFLKRVMCTFPIIKTF